MTDNQPSGVAGNLKRQLTASIADDPRNAERLYGAAMMADRLSAEARAILSAYDERLANIPEIQDEKRRIVWYQIQAVRLAFENLGLDVYAGGGALSATRPRTTGSGPISTQTHTNGTGGAKQG